MKLVAKYISPTSIDAIDIDEYVNNVNAQRYKLYERAGLTVQALERLESSEMTAELKEMSASKAVIDAVVDAKLHKYDDYMPLVCAAVPPRDKYTDIAARYTIDDQNRIIQTYVVTIDEKAKLRDEIAEIEAKLASTDYKVLKTYEARLLGTADPYEDIADVIAKRNEQRDAIEALRAKLAELDSAE